MPDAPEVTITEITGSIEFERGFEYGEGELICQGPGCTATIGYHLAIDYETDMDRGAFTPYWEIRTAYPGLQPPVDIMRLCEDDWAYLTDIAPAVIAYAAKS
jgi:hypothetical protein